MHDLISDVINYCDSSFNAPMGKLSVYD